MTLGQIDTHQKINPFLSLFKALFPYQTPASGWFLLAVIFDYKRYIKVRRSGQLKKFVFHHLQRDNF
jgi:hypothetical protein